MGENRWWCEHLVRACCAVLCRLSRLAQSPMSADQSGSPNRTILEAVLERITYANEETGYTIARVAPARGGGGGSDLLTVVGNLLGVRPGESLRLEGRWKSHPQ